jgi:hypothetical protein
MSAKNTRSHWLPRNHNRLYIQANATAEYLTPSVLDRLGIAGNQLIWYNSVFIPKHNLFNIAYEEWLNPA